MFLVRRHVKAGLRVGQGKAHDNRDARQSVGLGTEEIGVVRVGDLMIPTTF